MKQGECRKCGKFTWIDEHHVLPKSIFGGEGELVKLCPNCHRDYHEYLGRENLKNPSMEFHFYTFEKWLAGLTAFCLLIGFMVWTFWKR